MKAKTSADKKSEYTRVRVTRKTHVAVKKFAAKTGCKRLGDAVAKRFEESEPVAPAPVVAPAFSVPDGEVENRLVRWFFPDECGAESMQSLLTHRFSVQGLAKLAAEKLGVSPEGFARFAVALAAKNVVLDSARAEAGSGNATGVADGKIAAAFASLTEAGKSVTQASLKTASGTNGKAVFRWLVLHHPELLS